MVEEKEADSKADRQTDGELWGEGVRSIQFRQLFARSISSPFCIRYKSINSITYPPSETKRAMRGEEAKVANERPLSEQTHSPPAIPEGNYCS